MHNKQMFLYESLLCHVLLKEIFFYFVNLTNEIDPWIFSMLAHFIAEFWADNIEKLENKNHKM